MIFLKVEYVTKDLIHGLLLKNYITKMFSFLLYTLLYSGTPGWNFIALQKSIHYS
jgi:hypothetical protein